MDFALSPAAQDACDRMRDFMRECVLPAEPVYERWRAEHGEHDYPPVMEDLKAEARSTTPRSPRSPAGRR
jgi:acyl-CoA dehydrogenase